MRILDEIVLDQPDSVRLAFLEVLNWMLHADGVADDREQRFLDHTATLLGFEGLRHALPARSEDWKPAWTRILEPIAPYVLMQAALIAWADGELHDDERALLERLRRGLDLDPGVHDRVLRWAHDGYRWTMEGVALLARR